MDWEEKSARKSFGTKYDFKKRLIMQQFHLYNLHFE